MLIPRHAWLLIFVWLFCCLIVTALPARAQEAGQLLIAQPLFRDALSHPLVPKAPIAVRSAPYLPTAGTQPAARMPIEKGCSAKTLGDRATVFAGGWSHCIGGRRSLTEQRIETIDFDYDHMNAAAYAMQADPRSVMRAPLSATAGIALPVKGPAHIGVEYSYTNPFGPTPFHFGNQGGPADEVVGHSATVRLGLSL